MFRRCKNMYLFHLWGDWKQYKYNIMRQSGVIAAVEVRQERFCERCNKCEDECITIIYS